jgi:nicotinamide mononucleotide transporter
MDSLPGAWRAILSPAFTLLGGAITWLEIGAFLLALAMVVFNIRLHPLAWPMAIGSSLLYALLFVDTRLYGQAALQLAFVALAAWGWWRWRHEANVPAQARRVQRLSWAWRGAVAALTLAAWPALALALARYTDSPQPWLDALPTVASVTGQVLMALKRIETWPTWLAVNLVSMALFGSQGLWLTVLLYAVFIVSSVLGWRAWRRLESAHG